MKKYLTLVNKENKIKPSFIKKIELVKRKNYEKEEVLIEKQTALAFDELKEFLKTKNIFMEIDDSYRSIEHQKELKEQFKNQYGEEYANNIGLAFQIKDDILSEIGDEKVLGKPTGNDKEKGKCTYVTKYGLEESQKKLEVLTKEAIKRTEKYGEKGEFLKELALYMMERNK